jgi:hypothetical protein
MKGRQGKAYIPKFHRHDIRSAANMRRLVDCAPGPNRISTVPTSELDLGIVTHFSNNSSSSDEVLGYRYRYSEYNGWGSC